MLLLMLAAIPPIIVYIIFSRQINGGVDMSGIKANNSLIEKSFKHNFDYTRSNRMIDNKMIKIRRLDPQQYRL